MSRNGAQRQRQAVAARASRPSRRLNIRARSKGLTIKPLGYADPYAPGAGFADGWPIAYSRKAGWANLAHCYASVGVGRDLSPDTGTGGELYAVIGHAPRQLDRVIALVGRVVDGIDKLSSLPRGTEALGFYKDKAHVRADRRASGWRATMPAAERPSYEFMDTGSATFAAYLQAARQPARRFLHPPGGRGRPVQRPGAGAEEGLSLRPPRRGRRGSCAG